MWSGETLSARLLDVSGHRGLGCMLCAHHSQAESAPHGQAGMGWSMARFENQPLAVTLAAGLACNTRMLLSWEPRRKSELQYTGGGLPQCWDEVCCILTLTQHSAPEVKRKLTENHFSADDFS